MTDRELLQQKWEAEFRAADARLDAMHAEAKARKAKEEMDAILDLRAKRDLVRTKLTKLKAMATTMLEESKVQANLALRELDDAIDRASDKYAMWDAARERRFSTRLEEANANLREWKARAEKAGAELGMKGKEALARLEEDVALARARLSEWERDRHERKAEEALREAAKHFDEAYDAVRKQHA